MNTRVEMKDEMMEMVNGGAERTNRYKTINDILKDQNSEKKEEDEFTLKFYEF